MHSSFIQVSTFPGKNVEILKYMSDIREAATRYPANAWITYDQQLRLRKTSGSTRQSWESLNWELRRKVMSNPQNNSVSNTLKRPTRESASISSHLHSLTFNAFSDGNCAWNNCKFKHVCAACNALFHGRYNCPYMLHQFSDRQQNG